MIILLGLYFNVNNVGAIDFGLNASQMAADFTNNELDIFSQNKIFFYNPNECVGGSIGESLPGGTFKDKMWCLLRSRGFDEIHAAGILANSFSEAAPAQWEFWNEAAGCVNMNREFINGYNFDYYYNGAQKPKGGRLCGVGMFGFTSSITELLHHINDTEPQLLKYFQDPVQYSIGRDELLEKIGDADFDKLLILEFDYWLDNEVPRNDLFKLDEFKQTTTANAAARYFAKYYERCAACGYNWGDSELIKRGSLADELYAELKGEGSKCNAKSSSASSSSKSGSSSSSSSTTVNGGVTLIGDSVSVQAEKELQEKLPGAFMSKVGSRHPTSGGDCDGDEGGVSALKKIASSSGAVEDQHTSGECYKQSVDSNSLKENVVWELGANSAGAEEKSTLDEVIRIIGKNRKLFLVTPYNNVPGSKAGKISELYRKVADENDNVYVVDWNKAVSANESQYVVDERYAVVHPTEAGRKLLADLIAEAIGSTANCATAITYKDSEYKKRLANLHEFSQTQGRWQDELMCPNTSENCLIEGCGCGIMSLFAVYYMFTGNGLDNPQVFNELRNATIQDGYNACGASSAEKFGEALKAYTKMEMGETLWTEPYQDSYWLKLVDELKKGKKFVNYTDASDSVFSGGGHYLMFDHYDADKDAIYMFDPSIFDGRVRKSGVELATGGFLNGVYVTREQMDKYVRPRYPHPLTYYGQACENVCEEDGGGLKAGGMTKEEAEKFMEPYIKEAERLKKGNYGKGTQNSLTAVSGFEGDGVVYDTSGVVCPSTLNNCSAFSEWFINNYTTIGPSIGSWDGNATADGLIGLNNGITDGGSVPKPYAVFSTGFDRQNGHTGVVLGIGMVDGEMSMITGEAHCLTGGPPNVGVYRLSDVSNGTYKYAYTDDVLKTEKFSK